MDVFDSILLFLSGIFVGFFFYDKYVKLVESMYIDSHYKKPLSELEKRGLDIYKFVYRQDNFVVLSFDTNHYIYIDLAKKSFSVYQDKLFLFTSHSKLKKEFDLFYTKLIYKFNNEIYVDIITVNNINYSKNIFTAEVIEQFEAGKKEQNILNKNEEKFSIDAILEKIYNNSNGFNSLTKEEKDFLNKESKKDSDDK